MKKDAGNNNESFESCISSIALLHFGEAPITIRRISIGLCNEVFEVRLKDREIIARLSDVDDFIRGSQKHIPILKRMGIKVPDIIAEDYSKTNIPYSYQLLSKLKGKDIGLVIKSLSDAELQKIAKEISSIINKVKTIPANDSFGYFYDSYAETAETWTGWIGKVIDEAKNRARKTGVIDNGTLSILDELYRDNMEYLEQVKAIIYLDDICSKNVMIERGEFSGLVDLDCFAQGDPLESIGRIKASWPKTHHGEVYLNAIMDEQRLDTNKRKIVSMYALLNRISWASENGIRFNQNTDGVIDQERAERDMDAINQLYEEYKQS